MKFLLLGVLLCCASAGWAQQPAAATAEGRAAEIQELKQELQRISARLDVLERAEAAANAAGASAPAASSTAAKSSAATSPVTNAAVPSTTQPNVAATATVRAATATATAAASTQTLSRSDRATLDFFKATTLNVYFDGYYEYNFNDPIGRTNQLRAYDLTSNSFAISQADVIVEHLPVAEPGERFGGRLDLQFGQATEVTQGSSANELQPQVWRNVFQAYGSYLAPVGSGLRVDFGKWASTLGAEGSYAKDQINYTRGFLFDFLPFYHTGFRASYDVTPKLNVAYWLVNGTQQTDDFNGFKSQNFAFTLKPASSVTWNINYYFGQEQRDNTTAAPGSQPAPTPNGREHIFDTYATWSATSKLTLVGEADYVIDRVYQYSAPTHVSGGAAYVRYALPHDYAIAARTEYLSDRGGLFSGTTQALKEVTLTAERRLATGCLARVEYRRDFSNQRYFITQTQGALAPAQPTATLGLVYWWGMKQGAW